jgi:hypothetical protein
MCIGGCHAVVGVSKSHVMLSTKHETKERNNQNVSFLPIPAEEQRAYS